LHQGLLLLFIGSHSVLVCSHMRIIANSDYIVSKQGLKPDTPHHGLKYCGLRRAKALLSSNISTNSWPTHGLTAAQKPLA
jgi:hypothetical protein